MSKPPRLAAHELEALALLMEECAETAHAIGKTLRHGMRSTHPAGGSENREAVAREAGQIVAAIQIAASLGVLDVADVHRGIGEKWRKVGGYLHHIRVDPNYRIATAVAPPARAKKRRTR